MLNLLCWSAYMDNMVEKATERMYFIKQVKKAGLSRDHLFDTTARSYDQYSNIVFGVAICIDCSVLSLIKSVVSCQ